jgi:hypothetical protein
VKQCAEMSSEIFERFVRHAKSVGEGGIVAADGWQEPPSTLGNAPRAASSANAQGDVNDCELARYTPIACMRGMVESGMR